MEKLNEDKKKRMEIAKQIINILSENELTYDDVRRILNYLTATTRRSAENFTRSADAREVLRMPAQYDF